MTTAVLTDTLLSGRVRLPRSGPADPLVPQPSESYDEHVRRLGVKPVVNAGLLTTIEREGLLGHGGAFVPVGVKWRSALARRGHLTVVANAAESEPLAGKDGTLLRQRPHLVLDGLLITAQALGADRVVVWLHGDDSTGRRALARALRERVGLREPQVEIVDGPVHYLAGEAQAITRAMAGGPPLPFPRRNEVDPRAPQTLVHNAETLARIALITRGRPNPRTRLLSVLGSERYVLEVERTTTIEEVLIDLGWSVAPQAVLLGGYAGVWAAWDRVARLPVDEDVLRAQRLTLGAGVIFPLAADECGIQATSELIGYLASMSARQCGPCLFGLPAVHEQWQDIAASRAEPKSMVRHDEDIRAIEGRGACRHPDGVTRLVASARTTFAEHLAAHLDGTPCWYPYAARLPGVADA